MEWSLTWPVKGMCMRSWGSSVGEVSTGVGASRESHGFSTMARPELGAVSLSV